MCIEAFFINRHGETKMTKPSTKLLLVALVAAWLGIVLAAVDCPAQLYRYVDKNGKIVITDNPPPGVVAETIEQENAVLQPSKGANTPKDKPAPAPGVRPAPPSRGVDQVKEEVDKAAREEAARVAKEEADKVAKEEADKETSRIMAEEEAKKQAARQLRLEEADRLEKEARKPVQPTQENIDRQMKLMLEAQRLRDMP
jgi:tRNA uridine 5-carbamoylmethylation protein Kti12